MRTMFLCALILWSVSVIPAGAHIAVNDEFDVPRCYVAGPVIFPLDNDFPYPDPSVINIEITENPRYSTIECMKFWDSDWDWVCYPHITDYSYAGPDYFKYRTYDGSSYSNIAQVRMNIVPYNPCGSDASFTVEPGSKLSVYNPGWLGCPDVGQTIKIHDFSHPSHGVLNRCDTDGGCFNYVPDPGFTGWDSFTVWEWYDSGEYDYCPGNVIRASIYVGYGVPEFPSMVPPAIIIPGFLGLVLYLRIKQ